jgi:hypothetical protein
VFWAGKIYLPPVSKQATWESRRLARTGDEKFHTLATSSESVVYFYEINELAAEYLHTENSDDRLLKTWPYELIVELLKSREPQNKLYGITENVSGTASVGAPLVVT